jgi:5'-3' exonuclease
MSRDFDILAFDLSSLAYRSYYGLPDSIKGVDGRPVNAIKGYLDALNRFLKKHHPKSVIHAVDDNWRPSWRVDLLPEYKAHRLEDGNEEDVPDDLDYQLEKLPQILSDLGMQILGHPNFEADDVLATISHKFQNVLIITGDRDLLQLINDSRNIAVHLLGKDGGVLLTEESVFDKYNVRADQYLDYSVMRGDASDGLPGVKGVGEKTAAKLLKQFETIEGIIKNLDIDNTNISPKISQSILDSTEYIHKALKVVKLVNISDLRLHESKEVTLDTSFAKYKGLNIETQLRNYAEIIGSSTSSKTIGS